MTPTERIGGFISRGHAEMARGYLEDHGVSARVIGDDAGGAAPHFALGAGGIQLLVAAEEAEQARQLLAGLENAVAVGVEDGEAPYDGGLSRPVLTALGRVLGALAVIGIVVAFVVTRLA